MSNRLEHEFPAVRWPAPCRGSIDHDLVRAALARGRHLQGTAIRRGTRNVIAAVARALASFIRCGAYGIAKRAPEGDCGRAASHRA